VATQQRHLDIIALGTGPNAVYVDQVTLNNAPVSGAIVEDGPLQGDAVLRFIMRGTLVMSCCGVLSGNTYGLQMVGLTARSVASTAIVLICAGF
jgi:putative alpha-1,2-mannosidase